MAEPPAPFALLDLPAPLAQAIVSHASLSVQELAAVARTGRWGRRAVCLVCAPPTAAENLNVAGLAARLRAARTAEAGAVILVGAWRVHSVLALAREDAALLRHVRRLEFVFYVNNERPLLDASTFAALVAAFPQATFTCRDICYYALRYGVDSQTDATVAVLAEPRVTFLDFFSLQFPFRFFDADAGTSCWDALRRFAGRRVESATVKFYNGMNDIEEAAVALERAADSGFRVHHLTVALWTTVDDDALRMRVVRALCRIALDTTEVNGPFDAWPVFPQRMHKVSLINHPHSYAALEREFVAHGAVPTLLSIRIFEEQPIQRPRNPGAPLGRVLGLGVVEFEFSSATIWDVRNWESGPCPLLADAFALERLHLYGLPLRLQTSMLSAATAPVLRDVSLHISDARIRAQLHHMVSLLVDALARLPALRSVTLSAPFMHQRTSYFRTVKDRLAARLPDVTLREK